MAPEGLQTAIDARVAQVTNGRSFVRASGTEDVVRVYAEGDNQAQADQVEFGNLRFESNLNLAGN